MINKKVIGKKEMMEFENSKEDFEIIHYVRKQKKWTLEKLALLMKYKHYSSITHTVKPDMTLETFTKFLNIMNCSVLVKSLDGKICFELVTVDILRTAKNGVRQLSESEIIRHILMLNNLTFAKLAEKLGFNSRQQAFATLNYKTKIEKYYRYLNVLNCYIEVVDDDTGEVITVRPSETHYKYKTRENIV